LYYYSGKKKARENDVTSGHMTDVTSGHVTDITSGNVTDATSGHVTSDHVTSGDVISVTSLPVAHLSPNYDGLQVYMEERQVE
jgi:hypothetical protein